MSKPAIPPKQEVESMIRLVFTVAEILSRGASNDDLSKNPSQNLCENHELENLRYGEEDRKPNAS